MRNFILIALLSTTLFSGCAVVDEWLVRPFERDSEGALVETGDSKAEELIDKYDDTATLVVPVQHRWIIPTLVAAVALASTISTRVRARRKEEENGELAEEENKE